MYNLYKRDKSSYEIKYDKLSSIKMLLKFKHEIFGFITSPIYSPQLVNTITQKFIFSLFQTSASLLHLLIKMCLTYFKKYNWRRIIFLFNYTKQNKNINWKININILKFEIILSWSFEKKKLSSIHKIISEWIFSKRQTTSY